MPGGAVKEIPSHIEAAVRRMAPEADWGSLRSLAVNYQLERDHAERKETPSASRKSLDNIIETALYLRRDLALLKEEAADAIGDWNLIEATSRQLTLLINASKAGHNEIAPRDGRPGSLRKSFVRSVAGILARAGYETDGTPNGLLVAVVSDLLDVYDDKPADVPALVRSAMRENPAKPA
jgi:hypothetical protein